MKAEYLWLDGHPSCEKKQTMPVPKPYTRQPIPPVIRHKDRRRQEKHKKPVDEVSNQ